MRRVLGLIVVAMMMALAESYAEQPQGALIEFSQKVIELGELSQDDDVQIVRLSYKNVGDIPLVVTEVRTSCSCTEVNYKRGKVLPGESGVLTVTMDPSKAPEGSFYRVLQVISTSVSGIERITLKAEISK